MKHGDWNHGQMTQDQLGIETRSVQPSAATAAG